MYTHIPFHAPTLQVEILILAPTANVQPVGVCTFGRILPAPGIYTWLCLYVHWVVIACRLPAAAVDALGVFPSGHGSLEGPGITAVVLGPVHNQSQVDYNELGLKPLIVNRAQDLSLAAYPVNVDREFLVVNTGSGGGGGGGSRGPFH